MKYQGIRDIVAPLRHTPFHPQWFAFREEKERSIRIGEAAKGLVLDIGAGNQRIADYLTADCSYVSLDYPLTARNWYYTRPIVFGDGQALPFADNVFDTVLLLDVLEHLPRPARCIQEVSRVLRPGGMLVIHVPFLYPLHDAPLDFQRWTQYGLRELAATCGLEVKNERAIGTAGDTAALLSNLAFGEMVLRRPRSAIIVILAPLFPVIVLLRNVRAWLMNKLNGKEAGFMPHGYEVIWEKPSI